MRKKSNLNQFPHVSKNKQERIAYNDMINGTTKGLGSKEEDFEETSGGERKAAGNPKTIKKNLKPYQSRTSWVKQNWKAAILAPSVVTLGGWLLYTTVQYGRELSTLDANYKNIVTDVSDLQGKYNNINEKTIKGEVLLQEILKDLDLLSRNKTR